MPAKDTPIHSNALAQIDAREGIPVRLDTLYADSEGAEKKSIRKQADESLGRLKDILLKVLERDEAVFYIARAQEPLSAVEQLTLGRFSYAVTRTMLIITNRRILAFHAKVKSFGKWEWGHAVRSIRLGDVAEAKVSAGLFSGSVQLTYRDGKKEKYWNVQRKDAKKLRLLLNELLPMSTSESSQAQGPVSLCPNCVAALPAAPQECAQCHLAFATNGEMVRRSILWPGGGYFYVGQSGFGVLDALTESILLGVLLLWVLIALGLPEPIFDPLEPYTSRSEALIIAVVLAVFLVVEKLITILHGRHFVRQPYALTKPPSTMRWALWALAAYATIAGIVWSIIPPAQAVIAKVAPDFDVYQADFGVFGTKANGDALFTPASTVSHSPGSLYGFVLRFRTSRPSVKLRTEFVIEAMAELQAAAAAAGVPVDNPADESLAETKGGLLVRYWKVAPDEPEGQQTLKVFVDGVLVKSFSFTVK
ncbi:MAG TPA: hypothetical protein VGQ11_12220 [Candidatus Acidoferrales bacterium]|nr:hypothetical protein [Candidatus Acidoferrales bacterium]